jgi:hypothetical protein
MANSGTVTAGSAALASQYNNLRDDVLNVSTGHTHTGASEDGKKVEGSAIASTGATNGQVLAADGAGGASFTTPAQSGAFSAIYGTAAFATATNNGGSALRYQNPGGGLNYMTTTGAGTVVVAIGSADQGLTAGHRITTYTTGSTAILAGGTAWANVVAGTASFNAAGQGFSTATSQGFVIAETSQTSTTMTTTLRKFTNALVNSWNTQIVTGTVTTSVGFMGFGIIGPFASGLTSPGASVAKWAAGPGIWYGGDQRMREYMTTAGTMQQSAMRIVNDASGSVYSAPFGSAIDSGTNYSLINAYVFIPSSTAATDGTIHAWGVDNANSRYVTYAVGSASISAIATADYTYTGATSADLLAHFDFPVVGRIQDAMWLESENKLMTRTNDKVTFTDRTVGTALSVSTRRQNLSVSSLGNPTMGNLTTGAFDPITGYVVYSGSVSVIPSFDSMALPFGAIVGLPTGYTSLWTLCGPGSATFIIGSASTGGTTYRWDIAGVAKVQLDAASTANRLMTIEGGGGWDREQLVAVGGGGSGVDMTGGGSRIYGSVSLVASGTSPVTVYVQAFSEGTAYNTLSVGTPNPTYTIGGTATVKATKITLA